MKRLAILPSPALINARTRPQVAQKARGCARPLWKTAIRAGLGVLLIVAALSACSTTKIEANRFVQDFRGYAFFLPGAAWQIDPDAWTYNRDFGFRVEQPKPLEEYHRYRRDRNRTDFSRDRLPRIVPPKRKYIFKVDIGFRHASGKMNILAASTSRGQLVRLFRTWKYDTFNPVPENLVKSYLEVFPEFHPPARKGSLTVTEEPFTDTAALYRGEFRIAGETRALYGIPLQKDVLVFQLYAQKDTEPALLEQGRQTLEELARSTVALR